MLLIGSTLHLPGIQSKQLHVTNWGCLLSQIRVFNLTSEQFFLPKFTEPQTDLSAKVEYDFDILMLKYFKLMLLCTSTRKFCMFYFLCIYLKLYLLVTLQIKVFHQKKG